MLIMNMNDNGVEEGAEKGFIASAKSYAREVLALQSEGSALKFYLQCDYRNTFRTQNRFKALKAVRFKYKT